MTVESSNLTRLLKSTCMSLVRRPPLFLDIKKSSESFIQQRPEQSKYGSSISPQGTLLSRLLFNFSNEKFLNSKNPHYVEDKKVVDLLEVCRLSGMR